MGLYRYRYTCRYIDVDIHIVGTVAILKKIRNGGQKRIISYSRMAVRFGVKGLALLALRRNVQDFRDGRAGVLKVQSVQQEETSGTHQLGDGQGCA